ncbi:MAG: hypothetical protein HY695_01055 [Deltaproteobacteria bacterium]|nr:hypothetical protein [Deltaproteobacteria bacterium]
MTKTEDEKLETMLRARRVEPASPDLAQRIILKAQQTPQVRSVTLIEWINQVFAEFHLPRPAYVLAGALLIGFFVGLSTDLETTNDDPTPILAQSFLYTDEAIL